MIWCDLVVNHRVRYNNAPLAEGGFSFVYIARNASTGERYALKKMLCQVTEVVDGCSRLSLVLYVIMLSANTMARPQKRIH